jgi:hypothetical protein
MSETTRRPNQNFPTKLLTRARQGKNVLVPILRPGFPRKSVLRIIATCARSMGVHIPCTALVIVVGLTTKKIEKLERALKKSGKKARKHQNKDSKSGSK